MPEPAVFKDVEVPEQFDQWDRNAQNNYLQGAMDRTQAANYLRSLCGLEARDKPLLRKDEVVAVILEVCEDS